MIADVAAPGPAEVTLTFESPAADQVCTMDTGAPVLTAAVASLDCRTRLRQPMGDHEVIYGDVVAYRGDPGVDALGFFRGRFVTLKSEG